MAFKPIDPKRDEFRRYLERAGVIEALTKIFVRLVKERPENPMEYLQNNLGDSRLQADHEAFIRTELEEARAEIQRLRSIIMKLDPTALEDAKETASSETIQNAEGTTQTETEDSTVHTELESKVLSETAVVTEAAPQQAEPENSEKPADDDNNAEVPTKLEEKNAETQVNLEQKNNEASPQIDNKTDEVSAQLSETIVEAVAQSEETNTESALKSSDDNKADAIPQSEDKQIKKETE